MNKPRTALICGAGIAGCAAAMALARTGWSVTLLDKQAAWHFQSSGIFVYSNGLRFFRDLGVMDEMVAAGCPIEDGRNLYLNADGSPLVETFYPGRSDGPSVPPILGIRRADMHRVLSAQLDRLGVQTRLATTVESLAQDEHGVQARLSDGQVLRCDLLLGADGIRSRIRQLLWPQIEPRYSGFGVWRSVHRRPPELREKIMMMAPGLRLGIMPISAEQLYLFGTVSAPAGTWHEPTQWPALMQQTFAPFQGPARRFLEELGPHCEVLYTAVEEIIMDAPWHQGQVALIGDAAHASTPFMGQGGAMAVQDAVVLAELLARSQGIDTALTAFGRRRAPLCKFVQDVSRQVGITGAQSEPRQHQALVQAMAHSAQQRVDDFYEQLDRMSA